MPKGIERPAPVVIFGVTHILEDEMEIYIG